MDIHTKTLSCRCPWQSQFLHPILLQSVHAESPYFWSLKTRFISELAARLLNRIMDMLMLLPKLKRKGKEKERPQQMKTFLRPTHLLLGWNFNNNLSKSGIISGLLFKSPFRISRPTLQSDLHALTRVVLVSQSQEEQDLLITVLFIESGSCSETKGKRRTLKSVEASYTSSHTSYCHVITFLRHPSRYEHILENRD